jgi:hypothetical protein
VPVPPKAKNGRGHPAADREDAHVRLPSLLGPDPDTLAPSVPLQTEANRQITGSVKAATILRSVRRRGQVPAFQPASVYLDRALFSPALAALDPHNLLAAGRERLSHRVMPEGGWFYS